MSRNITDKPLISLELWTSDTVSQLAENTQDAAKMAGLQRGNRNNRSGFAICTATDGREALFVKRKQPSAILLLYRRRVNLDGLLLLSGGKIAARGPRRRCDNLR